MSSYQLIDDFLYLIIASSSHPYFQCIKKHKNIRQYFTNDGTLEDLNESKESMDSEIEENKGLQLKYNISSNDKKENLLIDL